MIAQRLQRFIAGVGVDDFNVVVAEQFVNAHLLDAIVFDDEKTFAARLGKLPDPRHRVGNAVTRRRLGHKREGAARQTMLAIFVERHDLNGNVPGERVLFELAQHSPAQHVGQEHVERNGGWLVLFGQAERLVAAHRQQCLEALVAGQVDQNTRVVRIVLDNKENAVAGVDIHPVIRNGLDCPLADPGTRKRWR